MFPSFIPPLFDTGVSDAGFYIIYQQYKVNVVPSQTMKEHGAVEVQLFSFLIPAPSPFAAGRRSHSQCVRFTDEKISCPYRHSNHGSFTQ